MKTYRVDATFIDQIRELNRELDRIRARENQDTTENRLDRESVYFRLAVVAMTMADYAEELDGEGDQ